MRQWTGSACHVFCGIKFIVHFYLQALIDRPDETRRVESFKRLTITDFKVEMPRLAKKSVLKKALDEAGRYLSY